MKIIFVVSSLTGGGAARVITNIANYWSEHGNEVTILTTDAGGSLYPLLETVNRRALEIQSESHSLLEGFHKNIKRLYLLRRAMAALRADYIISFLTVTNILVIISTLFIPAKVIVSERNHPLHSRERRSVWAVLRRVIYPLADHLVVQNSEIQSYFEKYNDSVHVIPNPVSLEMGGSQRKSGTEPLPPGNCMIGMGRLVEQKGFDTLIEVFSALRNHHREWNLLLLGQGPLEKDLQKIARFFGVENSVYFFGQVENPFTILKACDIFVLSSRFEGFPNALLEAMACGLPVVSFDCPSGPSDIIQNGKNGMLVPPENKKLLEETLDELMGNRKLRRQLGENALDVIERYSLKKIMNRWNRLCDSTL